MAGSLVVGGTAVGLLVVPLLLSSYSMIDAIDDEVLWECS